MEINRSIINLFKIKNHVLLPRASQLAEVDAGLKARLTPEKIREIVALIPEDWLALLGGIVFYNRLCSVNLAYSFSWLMGY